MNASTALLMVAKTEFRPFTLADYDAFAGVTGECPMIGECDDYVIVIGCNRDGDVIQITDCEMGSCYSFTLGGPIQIF